MHRLDLPQAVQLFNWGEDNKDALSGQTIAILVGPSGSLAVPPPLRSVSLSLRSHRRTRLLFSTSKLRCPSQIGIKVSLCWNAQVASKGSVLSIAVNLNTPGARRVQH